MKGLIPPPILALTVVALFPACSTIPNRDYPIKAVPFTQVQLTDNFWAARMRTNATVTVPHAFGQLRETGIINNFAIAGGLSTGEQCGNYPFDDSDVYKTIEAASYTLASSHDQQLKVFVDSLIVKIAAAQEDDGYLYTARTNNTTRFVNSMGASRWSKLRSSHELYNAGHLYEAAVAHFQATGERTLLDLALRNAELIAATFGPDKKRLPPGHQEIELGLVKLYRITAEKKYLDLAKFFLEERGHAHEGRELWGEYAQDHEPIFEQDEAVGHAVRAPYMYAAMADVAALTGDARYEQALDRLWENVAGKKFFITGGLGSVSFGESFGPNYELPNMTAYNETCSSIANMFWQYRLFQLRGEAKYLDVFERTLYNAFLSGISLAGNRFYYDNPLASRGQHQRRPWFYCSCCPGNVARFIASLPQYFYAHTGEAIYVNLFAAGTAKIALAHQTVRLVQNARYPWDGQIELTIEPEQPATFTIFLRVPGWARHEPVPSDLYRFHPQDHDSVALAVNAQAQSLNLSKGYAALRRRWQKGDRITLHLPMPVRRVRAHEKVKADAGRVALQRGPIVYCAEGPDNNGHVLNLVLRDEAELQSHFRADLLQGVQTITGKAFATQFSPNGQSLEMSEQPFAAIPYYAWAHRGPGEMSVWLAAEVEKSQPLFGPSLASTSKVASSNGQGMAALNDEKIPGAEPVHIEDIFVWTTRKDTLWVQYRFAQTEEVSEAQVYWYDNGTTCQVPKSWRLLARFNGGWHRVWVDNQPWGVEKNKFNKVLFETARTDTLRLEVIPQPEVTAGVLEWRVY
ncbi:MAG: glycoside hydrolase family 127 protein [bacterium]